MTLAELHELLAARASVRAFAPTPLPRARLAALFATAQRAAARGGMPGPELAFPIDYPEPYQGHRRACGGALYGAMGLARDDKAGRYDAWLRNFALFDAPHVAIVSVDRRLGPYALIDVGVWLGTLLAAAAADEVAAGSAPTYFW